MDDEIVLRTESNCYINVLKSVEFKTIYNENLASSYIETVDYIDIMRWTHYACIIIA